jgi:hypothetical protein
MYSLLEQKTIARLMNEHSSGKADHHKILFSLVVFEEWLRNGGDPSPRTGKDRNGFSPKQELSPCSVISLSASLCCQICLLLVPRFPPAKLRGNEFLVRRIVKSSAVIGGSSVINILLGIVRTKVLAVLLAQRALV